MEAVPDGDACRVHYYSLIVIVRSFGRRPRLEIRMAANRDLPTEQFLHYVVIAR